MLKTLTRTLPIIFLLNLKTMHKRRRIELITTFSIGMLAILGSAFRLHIMFLWVSDYVHQPENSANLMIWSQVEQNVGIIAGSLPFLRPLFRKALVRARSSGQRSPGPIIQLISANGDEAHDEFVPRSLIIPSPSPTCGEFRRPEGELPPVEMVGTQGLSWGSAIWDGTQVRQVLPT
jgi:hypothetical protein